MHTTARLAHASLPFDAAASTHLVVSLTAPPLDAAAPRPPVCVVPVIDVSGSMEGDKLLMAKRSLLKLVDHLGPQDRCGLVIFATDVRVVSPVVSLTAEGKARLKLLVGELQATSSTNLSGGLLEGLGLANGARLPDEALVRVILLTDGHANQGIATTAAQLLPLLDAHRGRATVSAFGYGRDADQDLLADLSKRGAGNYAFIDGADAALKAFARELGGLLSTFATDLVVRVTPAPGVVVAEVLSDVAAEPDGPSLVLRADDILAEEERHLVLAVELPPLPVPQTTPAFQVELSWRSLVGGAVRVEGAAHAVAVDRVEAALAQRGPDPGLDVIVAQAELLAAQLAAEALARAGQYRQAEATLHLAALGLHSRGHTAEAGAAEALAGKVRDRASYEGSGAMRKSLQVKMSRGSSSGEEAESEALSARMGRRTRTRAQEEMDASFRGSPGGSTATPSSGSQAGSQAGTGSRSGAGSGTGSGSAPAGSPPAGSPPHRTSSGSGRPVGPVRRRSGRW